MTAREILDGLSETLMCDERILSVPERELLTNLLQRTQTNGSTRDNAVAETIARAVGEPSHNVHMEFWETASRSG